MALCLLFVLSATAQVKFTVDYKRVSPTELHIVFKGKADKGWHVYSAQVPADGPNPTAFVVDKISGAKLKGGLVEGAGKKTEYDDMFMMNVGYFEGNMTFTQKVEITEKNFAIEGYLDYQACGEGQCIVDKAECKQSGTDGPTATTPEKVAPAEPTAAVPTVSAPTTTEDGTMTAALDSVLAETSPEAPIATATTADSNLIKAWWSPSIGNLKALGGDEAAVADLAFWMQQNVCRLLAFQLTWLWA